GKEATAFRVRTVPRFYLECDSKCGLDYANCLKSTAKQADPNRSIEVNVHSFKLEPSKKKLLIFASAKFKTENKTPVCPLSFDSTFQLDSSKKCIVQLPGYDYNYTKSFC